MYVKQYALILLSFFLLSAHVNNCKMSAFTKFKNGIIPSSWHMPIRIVLGAGAVATQLYALHAVRSTLAHRHMFTFRTLIMPGLLTYLSVTAFKTILPGGALHACTEHEIVRTAHELKKEIMAFTNNNGTISVSDAIARIKRTCFSKDTHSITLHTLPELIKKADWCNEKLVLLGHSPIPYIPMLKMVEKHVYTELKTGALDIVAILCLGVYGIMHLKDFW